MGLALTLALAAGGCVSNEELDQARMDRDEFRGELQRLHLSNDDLKREISAAYASCDQIDNQLTVMAAMNIHERYTDKLGRPPQSITETKPDAGPKTSPGSKPDNPTKVVEKKPVRETKPAVEQKSVSSSDMTGADFGSYGK